MIVRVGVDHGDFHPIDQINDLYADFAIVEAIIDLFNRDPLENAHGIFKGNAMSSKIFTAFFVRPRIAQSMYYPCCEG
jgi:hypothetical protein